VKTSDNVADGMMYLHIWK